MQEKLTIARPYAAAAFDYAEQHADIDAWANMLNALALAVSDEQLAYYIGHPKISDQQMLELLTDVLGASMDEFKRNFVSALVDAERLEIAPQIAVLFDRRRADAAGLTHVRVTSAHPLNAKEQQKIEAAMQARLGRKCTIEAEVDATLIGGAVIKIGDSVIDLSLRGRLTALEQQIS